jgi:nucleotidyltransferase/DNA polymerase involved in DNA repair
MPSPSIDVLGDVSGVGPATLQAFREAGYRTLGDLKGATLDDLTERLVSAIRPDMGAGWRRCSRGSSASGHEVRRTKCFFGR